MKKEFNKNNIIMINDKITENIIEETLNIIKEDYLNNKSKLIAEICHNINKSYCESQGDFSQKDWNEAPDWQKESAKKGVKFHLENENSTPADTHNSWMKEKVEDGWIYGEIKDADKKTHPCLVPYEQLPTNQKAKDYIFKAVVDNLKNYNSHKGMILINEEQYYELRLIYFKQEALDNYDIDKLPTYEKALDYYANLHQYKNWIEFEKSVLEGKFN